jgi:hypothetical protein
MSGLDVSAVETDALLTPPDGLDGNAVETHVLYKPPAGADASAVATHVLFTPPAGLDAEEIETFVLITSGGINYGSQTLSSIDQSVLAIPTVTATIDQTLSGIVNVALADGSLQAIIDAEISGEGTLYLVELYPLNRATDVVEEIHYSDGHYVSPPGGSKENEYFEGRVSQPLHLTRSIAVTPESPRRITMEVVGIEIINTDSEFDDYIGGYSIDGRLVVVKIGIKTWRYDQFVTIYQGRGVSWRYDLDKIEVTARDESHSLDVPLQSNSKGSYIYGGTGGSDGTAELAGKPMPMTFGRALNVSPVLVDPVNLVYQVHVRTVHLIDAYDRGAQLTYTSDYADFAALCAAPLSVGEFASSLAYGLFRLGSIPSGLVTANVQGDAVGGYITDTFGIVRRIINDFSPLDDTNLLLSDFIAMQTAVPWEMGWFRSTEMIDVSDAISDIVGHCASFWGGTPQGHITVGRLDTPDPSAVSLYLNSYDLKNLSIVDPPANVMPPRYRQRVSYQKNWTIQRGEDLAAVVTGARRQFLVEPYSLVSSVNAATQADFLLAQDPPILESLFYRFVDAQTECDRLLDLLSGPNLTVEAQCGFNGHMIRLGRTVQLTHPRVNGGNPWTAIVIGQNIDAQNETISAILWGPIS